MKNLFCYFVAISAAITMMACEDKPTKEEQPIAVTGVQLNQKTLAITAGETAVLTATVFPENAANKKVTWKSTNTIAATVADGTVTALKEGQTTIVVTTEDGEFTDECVVTVNAPVYPATGVTLDREAMTIAAGEQSLLTATVAPSNADQSVTWSSSDEAVATVVDGTVTGKGKGTAVITVTSNDGGFEETASVTVEGVLINGVVWAETNVGMPGTFVATPEELGMFYEWGSRTGWSSTNPMQDSDGGTTWKEGAVDAAQWSNSPCPAGWHLPSKTDIYKLVFDNLEGINDKVSRDYVAHGAVNGAVFTDNALGTSIFLPAAGYRICASYGYLMNQNKLGYYWTGENVEGSVIESHRLYFNQSKNKAGELTTTFDPLAIMLHHFALSIRCVK